MISRTNRLLRQISRQRPLAFTYASRFTAGVGTTTTAAAESISEFRDESTCPASDGMFPWRQQCAITEKSWQEYLQNAVARLLIHEWLLSFPSEQHPSSSYLEIDFLLGTKQAFRAAVAAIFKHEKLKRSSKGASNNNDSTTSSSNEVNEGVTATDSADFVPELSTVLENQLAQFYEFAISTSSKSKLHICYEIGEIGTPSIESYDVIFGGKRGKDFSGLKRLNTLGLIGTIGAETKPTAWEISAFFSNSSEKGNVPKHLQELLGMRKYATVRLGVNIPLTEKFWVKDELTGTIIQGSADEVPAVHTVLLEATLTANESRPYAEWTICDIDGWLKGNEFWLNTKMKKVDKM